ncbi:hypothetical protein [Catellatospora sp. NPDC049133]|uniref:hypothetical protein n=1 Tax=Catellatospora sp. NPDC049133 TaxID=3155499 RepID=UPI0033EF95A4
MFRLLRRIGQYAFCLMFVGIGLVAFAVFDRDDERWWVGPAFVGVGVVLMAVFFLFNRWSDRRDAILRHGVDGRGLVTEVKPTAQWDSNDVRYFRMTMTVELPGRAPYPATPASRTTARAGTVSDRASWCPCGSISAIPAASWWRPTC